MNLELLNAVHALQRAETLQGNLKGESGGLNEKLSQNMNEVKNRDDSAEL